MNFNFDWNCISAGGPYVTISELGLAFNQPAIAMLNNPETVVIGFDKDNMTIGIADAENMPSDTKSYKFYSRLNNGWVRIGCRDFVKYLSNISGKKFSPAIRFIPQFDDESKIMFVTITKGEEVEEEKDE